MPQDVTPATPVPPQSNAIRNLALAGAIITPLAMLLPPRKMDIRFFVLASAFSLSTNQLAYEYTGESIYTRFGNRASAVFDTGLPEGAKRTQQLLREQREREAAEKKKKDNAGSLVKGIWMGNETEGWQEKRAEEHKRSIEEGKGLSGIIFEQISDVWNGNYGKSSTKSEEESSSSEDGDDKTPSAGTGAAKR